MRESKLPKVFLWDMTNKAFRNNHSNYINISPVEKINSDRENLRYH